MFFFEKVNFYFLIKKYWHFIKILIIKIVLKKTRELIIFIFFTFSSYENEFEKISCWSINLDSYSNEQCICIEFKFNWNRYKFKSYWCYWGTSYSGASVTGSLNLTVTAQVLPTLSLDISAGSLDLWVLDSSIVSTGSLDVKLSTNATDGANVTVSSNTGWLASTQGDLIEYVNTVVAGTQGYNLTVSNNVADGGAIPSIANATVENLADASILTVDNPTKDAQVTVQANASIDTLTPSGDYSVVHTFTVTGNF